MDTDYNYEDDIFEDSLYEISDYEIENNDDLVKYNLQFLDDTLELAGIQGDDNEWYR